MQTQRAPRHGVEGVTKGLLGAYFVISSLGYLALGEPILGGYLDELLVALLCLVALVAGTRKLPVSVFRVLTIALLLFAWGTISLFADPVFDRAPRLELAFTAASIDLKPYLLTAAFLTILLQLDQSGRSRMTRFICYLFLSLALANLPFCLLDIVRGVSIHDAPLEIRAGLPVPLGMYDLKVKTAFTALMGLIAVLALRPRFKSSGSYFALLAVMSVSLLTILSVKEIFAAIAVLALHLTQRSKGWGIIAVIVFLFVVTGVFSTNNPISAAFNNRFTTFVSRSDTTRAKFYLAAPKVASDYAPLGAGWGTFGSSASRDVYYSPLYYTYDIAHTWGGSEKFGSFLMDTFWPRIIAEQGWLGFLLYIWLWLKCGGEALKYAFSSRRSIGMRFALYSYVALLITSLANPVYNYADGALACGFGFALLFPYAASKRGRAGIKRRPAGPQWASPVPAG
jgi:hypothetical protein